MHEPVQSSPTHGRLESEQENAFLDQLYRDHARAILAYLRYAHAPEQEVEDVLLEVFLVACEQQHLLRSRPPQVQRAWLRSVARHKLADVYRGQRESITLEEVAETLYEDEAFAPEHVTMRRETLAHLARVLQGLPKRQQAVVKLRFVYGLSLAEIATVIGKREATVRKRLTRALQVVRRLGISE